MKWRDEGEGDEEKLKKSLESEEKTLIILEALEPCTNWRQLFNLLEVIHQHIVVAFQHLELHTDKVKDIAN